MTRPSVSERFWSQVRSAPADECWIWGGYTNSDGYGRFSNGIRQVMVHRWVYEELRAPIPDGLSIDHLCRTRSCVNPWHLEPVTHAVNCYRARLTHCRKGHEYTPENTDSYGRGRKCTACRRVVNAAWIREHRVRRPASAA